MLEVRWLVSCLWFSPDVPVSSNNKTHRYDITDLLLKVALNTITLYMNGEFRYIYKQDIKTWSSQCGDPEKRACIY